MKLPKFSALAFAVLASCGAPAAAAPVDYDIFMPLTDIAGEPDTAPTMLLRGTLSYDDGTMSGSGAFTFESSDWNVTQTFAGFSFLLPYDDGTTGALFDGTALDGSELYFNVLANTSDSSIMSGPVSICNVGCAMFNSVGVSITPTALPGTSLPGGIALPGGVSPVPLPPAVSLFGAALLGLAGLGAMRRRVLRPQVVYKA
jgi:hypothetical protein